MANIPSHRNVVTLMGFCRQPACIVTEFIDSGSLKEFLRSTKNELDLRTAINFLRDTIDGIGHLHDHNIVHRDIAARNVLLRSNLSCVVSDMGLSRQLVVETTGQTKTAYGPIKVEKKNLYFFFFLDLNLTKQILRNE